MKLRFEPVTTANRAQALALAVHPAQAGFVEPVEECLTQADAERGWRPVLIYVEELGGGARSADRAKNGADGDERGMADRDGVAGDTANAAAITETNTDGIALAGGSSAPVGFAMYKYFGLFAPFGRAWLDRLLVDARYQGHGYGAAAVTALCARIRAEYGCRKVYLSVYGDNAAAIRLYEKAGFAFNGQLDRKGEKVMVSRGVSSKKSTV